MPVELRLEVQARAAIGVVGIGGGVAGLVMVHPGLVNAHRVMPGRDGRGGRGGGGHF